MKLMNWVYDYSTVNLITSTTSTYKERSMKPIFAVLCLVLGTGLAQAATFTVCSSGCNYTTIAAAYNTASCSDTIQVNVSGGINEILTLSKNCNAGSPITITAGTGYTPRIDTTSTSWLDGAVRITGSYNIWDKISIYDIAHGNGMYITGSNNRVQNSNFDRISYNDWPAGQNASGILIRGSYNVIVNNFFGDTDHDNVALDGIGYTTRSNQIMNNIMANHYGHGVTVIGIGAQYNLVDGNDISICGNLCVGSGCASKNAIQIGGASYNSFRRNIIHDIYNRAIEISSYSAATDTTTNNIFYNNTFYNITTRADNTSTGGWVIASVAVPTHTVANNAFYNNIADKIGQRINTDLWSNYVGFAVYYAAENDAGDSLSQLTANNWNRNVLVKNIIRPYYSGSYQPNSTAAIYYTNAGGSYHGGWSVSGVNGIGSMAGNITSDPLFVSTNTATPHWWYLQSGSPAIDAGVVVNDPNAANGGWAQLTYNGSAPDIGAFEYTSSGSELSAPTLQIIQSGY